MVSRWKTFAASARCPVCEFNLDHHRFVPIVRCLNPRCDNFDRWSAFRDGKLIGVSAGVQRAAQAAQNRHRN